MSLIGAVAAAMSFSGDDDRDTLSVATSTPATAEPRQTTAAFWQAITSLPYYEIATTLPPPDDVATLTEQARAVVAGDVTEVRVVRSLWKPAPDVPNEAARIDVEVFVAVNDVLSGDGTKAGEQVIWTMPAWIGDPLLAAEQERQVQDIVGRGPLGAEALLFLTPAQPETGAWWAITGVLESNGTATRVDFGRYSADPRTADLGTVASARSAVVRAQDAPS
jgi:hypothetical protein